MANWIDRWKNNMDYFQHEILSMATGTKEDTVQVEDGKPTYKLNMFRVYFFLFNVAIWLIARYVFEGSWGFIFIVLAGIMLVTDLVYLSIYGWQWGRYKWTKQKR